MSNEAGDYAYGWFREEVDMRIAIIGAAFCIALTSAAIGGTGGYPASPSHGITGTNPDGTPHYGTEPKKDAGASAERTGRSAGSASDRNSAVAPPDTGKRPDAK